MERFVGQAAGYASGCAAAGCGSGTLTDNFPNDPGTRAMGYYDQDFLNYYYYMASQFALSDRWFSPVASKSTPNRIATISGGTTQGLTNDPFKSDHLTGSLAITTIFQELDTGQPAGFLENLLRHHAKRMRAAEYRNTCMRRYSGNGLELFHLWL